MSWCSGVLPIFERDLYNDRRGKLYHVIKLWTTLTPSRQFFCCFTNHALKKKANHAITPPARGASDMKSVSFLQMIYMLCSKISYLPTTFSTAHDFKFSNDAFLFAAMILLWCFFVTSSKMDVLYWSRTPSHFFPVNFQNNSNLQLWNCFNIFHHWYM